MPLPEVSVSRDPMHTRTVRINAFRRADGACDLKAELCDTKPFVTPLRTDGPAVGFYYPKWHRPEPAEAASEESCVSSKEQS